MIKAVIFDFGGVLAEKGFRKGLKAIGIQNGLNPDSFFMTAAELIYQTGYVTGRCFLWMTMLKI
jgi:putative hydrolase of the HAD superfamily